MARVRRLTCWGVLLAALLQTAPALAQEPLPVTFHSSDDEKGADILGAFGDSLKVLLFEHGMRVGFQEKTRRELGGHFFGDYTRSVRMPRQWGDTDAWWVNCIGHPLHGAAAGYLWLDHEPDAPSTFSGDGRDWASRGRAMAWSAVYSLQFEVGPLSEASIGRLSNVSTGRLPWSRPDRPLKWRAP